MGGKYTKRYTEEFERDAIALVDSSGKTVTAVAGELGISSESLRGWYRGSRRTGARASPVSWPAPSARSSSGCARRSANSGRQSRS
ncbi:transposase [Streptomyces achmelvichensis]|uniref:transposase n=1 Tax=Streptomyces achmelvichensis TaxID=3134111 RepID=UPI003C12B8FB